MGEINIVIIGSLAAGINAALTIRKNLKSAPIKNHNCGGLIGMRAAYSLAKQGKKVYAIVKSPHVLIKAADQISAQIIQNHIRIYGIEVLTGCDVKEVIGQDKIRQFY